MKGFKIMIISKKRFKELIAKAIIETARQLGKNLTVKQKNEVYRKLSLKRSEDEN